MLVLFRFWILKYFLAWALISWASTSFSQELVGLPQDPDAKPDFSGSWQKDYRRSDNWEQKVNQTINQMRYDMQRQQRNGFEMGAGPVAIQGAGGSGRANIIDLARFTELISRHNDLFITQTEDFIQIKREGEADLICDLGETPIRTYSDDFGSEVCGWNEDRLIFIISLPDKIDIRYQFAVSEDRHSINLITNVSSNDSLDFELVQFFTRYETPQGEYDCKQTLSKGKVCTQSRRQEAAEL